MFMSSVPVPLLHSLQSVSQFISLQSIAITPMHAHIFIRALVISILSLLTQAHKALSILTSTATLATTPPTSPPPSDDVSYSQARDVRTKQGHHAAVPLYQQLLKNPGDVTAATRIAASPSSPQRHDQTCPIPRGQEAEGDDNEILTAISKLRSILQQSQYDNQRIQKMFGIKPFSSRQELQNGVIRTTTTKAESLAFAKGPVYIMPVSAGAGAQLPSFLDDSHGSSSSERNIADSSLHCLVALFLLGFAGE